MCDLDERNVEKGKNGSDKKILDKNGVDIFKKKSKDKTVDERIKTSRSLKIKYNKWNQVDFIEDSRPEKVTIDENYSKRQYTIEDIAFEKMFHEIISNSKYKAILLNTEFERVQISYRTINDILLYAYSRMKGEYTLSRIFVMVCEYCGINIQTMWKRLSLYIQNRIMEELSEFSHLPEMELNKDEKLF